MKFNLNDFLSAVSFALDFVEIDFLGATSNHSRRVSYISQRLAECFGMGEEEKFDLLSFSMLHDNGLSEDVMLTGVPAELPPEKHQQLELYTIHCDIGEKNVVDFPFLTDQKNIIRYHHENYDGSGFAGVAGSDIPLMAQIIALADTVDNLYHFETRNLANRRTISNFIGRYRGRFYSPELVDAFMEISSHTSFWLDLQEPFIYGVLGEGKGELSRVVDISLEGIAEITKVFSKIIDSKSKFTYRHTVGLIEKVGVMSDFYKLDQEHKIRLVIAASLHDLGKLAIPNAILDKPGKLTNEEFSIIKEHTYYTRVALSKIGGFENICNWAANHHETLDGAGYPYGIHGGDLAFEDRLIACLDIYQALTEIRPYRNGMSFDKTMSILEKNVLSGKIDKMIVADIGTVFG